uniref:V-SNARE coiled-coil homology domain-containing protein n=1 Tax=Kwoniella pini CBS 10737 TaxID=1296096 RepID=A0A1B9HUM4_9TREE|nr:uncharacterized protein I206_06743 [Kwoniella pini CBS 10737]OCF46969.1 hypothetical protein I206_06743 [Kwoniella pini CBS 10737]
MNAVQKELDSTKQVLFNNIDKINERGQRLDHLEQQTQDLSIQSRTFNQTAKKANRAMWWKNKKVSKLHFPLLYVAFALVE